MFIWYFAATFVHKENLNVPKIIWRSEGWNTLQIIVLENIYLYTLIDFIREVVERPYYIRSLNIAHRQFSCSNIWLDHSQLDINVYPILSSQLTRSSSVMLCWHPPCRHLVYPLSLDWCRSKPSFRWLSSSFAIKQQINQISHAATFVYAPPRNWMIGEQLEGNKEKLRRFRFPGGFV